MFLKYRYLILSRQWTKYLNNINYNPTLSQNINYTKMEYLMKEGFKKN